MALPLIASTAGTCNRSKTSSRRQKPTRFPYSCHAQLGTSGIGDPPAGGGRTVRGSGSSGFHSSTLTITHTARRAPPGKTRRGRSTMGEYVKRSVGSIGLSITDSNRRRARDALFRPQRSDRIQAHGSGRRNKARHERDDDHQCRDADHVIGSRPLTPIVLPAGTGQLRWRLRGPVIFQTRAASPRGA